MKYDEYKALEISTIMIPIYLILAIIMVLFGCGVFNRLTIFYKNSIKLLKSLFISFQRFYNSLNLYARGIVCLIHFQTYSKEYQIANIRRQDGAYCKHYRRHLCLGLPQVLVWLPCMSQYTRQAV